MERNRKRKLQPNYFERKKARNKKELPRTLEPLSVDDFIIAIKDTIHRGGKPQLLVFSTQNGKTEATRNIASNHTAMCTVTLSTPFPTPKAGTETYITEENAYQTGKGGRPHSENKGMMDDWHGCYRAMQIFLEDPVSRNIFVTAFGEDFRFRPERGYYRRAHLSKDLSKNPDKLLVHRDYPNWIRSKTEQVEVVTAKCKAGEVALALIDQNEYHGIPEGGDCVGWFLSVTSPNGHQTYLNKVDQHITKLRAGTLKSINHDPEGYQDGFSALDSLLFDFCKGSRPHLYESGKIIQAPHGMTANTFPTRQHRYLTPKAFAEIRETEICPSISECMGRLKKRGLDYAFQNVVNKSTSWNVDPSSFSNEALLRFFGIRPILP